jgi:predicted 3-demethylubiquinone-9 3-methyltransferase (glyoxalase superfamily)
MSSFQDYPRISPFLWFDSNAEEAADFYVSVFPNSRKLGQMRSSADTPSAPAGSVLTVSFELDGVKFTALNGGSEHKFNDAVSFVVRCETQDEIDYYWSTLTEGGSEIACGWLKDRFGLCWQIVPAQILELIRHPKVMEAMMKMTKFDIAALQQAASL